MSPLDGIKHVVVLMLENRSFDCMFGKLYPKGLAFEGLSGDETNLFRTPAGLVRNTVWNSTNMDSLAACVPNPDPGELFADMNEQLFGEAGERSREPPPMSCFIANYMDNCLPIDPLIRSR
jgi:phospholipase C